VNHTDTLHMKDDLLPPDVREAMRTRSRERGRTMRVGIVGGGVVGHATARMLMEWADVRVHDALPQRSTHSLAEALDTELCFVCLPTPQCENSLACDTSHIEKFFASVQGHQGNVVLRSTVPIGFTKKMREMYGLTNLCHSPEFLTARAAVVDAQTPARNIIGGVPGPGGCACEELLESLYRRRFPGVPVLRMTSDESEATKSFLNGFFAVKVSYFNEVRTLADALGLNWDAVLAGVLSDGRIAHAHTKVPGPDGKFGFGPDTKNGCLQKDSASLVHQLESNGLLASVTRGAVERNRDDRMRKA
jgi:UDP-glucose 6-dehydrogenase